MLLIHKKAMMPLTAHLPAQTCQPEVFTTEKRNNGAGCTRVIKKNVFTRVIIPGARSRKSIRGQNGTKSGATQAVYLPGTSYIPGAYL